MSDNNLFSHERMLDRDGKRDVASLWSATSSRGVVATAHYLATAAGVGALERGGNAVDAAVAASFALSVSESAGSGLGGMAMMLIYDAALGRTLVLDGACLAPKRATPEIVAASRRYHGYGAIAVPRHAAVMHHALARFGTLTVSDVLAPAIQIAEEGFPLSVMQCALADNYRKHLKKGRAAPFFLDGNLNAYPPATIFRQPVLARTLRRLERDGIEDFYHGAIAREVVADMEEHGGFIGVDDLREAWDVREKTPIAGEFAGGTVLTLGPPAGGIALIQMLHMASHFDGDELDLATPSGVVHVAAIIRRARRDRTRFRLRTKADDVGEARELLELAYAKSAARRVREALTKSVKERPDVVAAPDQGGETSHLSIMDDGGNVVALTQSIERNFGSTELTPSLGFVYNGYLRAFKVRNRRHPHYLRPGAPARSNAAPTITFRDRASATPHAALGSAGSERMSSGIAEVLLRLERESPFDAVHGPRLHCTPDGHVLWEEDRFPSGCREALLAHGFTVEALDPYSFKMGGLQLAVRQGDEFCGVAEPRRDGAAAGPRK